MIRLYALYLPLLMILVSVPMVMRRVPPNGLYGFRTPKTLSNPQIWYQANRLAGVNLIVAAILTMAFCWAVAWASSAAKATMLAPLVLLVMVAVSVVVSLLQVKEM